MEPMTTLAVALAEKSGDAAVDVAKEEATGFLRKLLGPSAEAIGESFAIRFRERMFNNLVNVVARAKRTLKDKGVEPSEVPLKIVHPLLEAAALEEEPDLQELWANLLAGAASHATRFLPAYIDILRHLSTEEVKFLTVMMQSLDQRITVWEKEEPQNRRNHPADRLGRFADLKSSFEDANGYPHGDEHTVFIAASIDNLCRLGILRQPSMGHPAYRLETFGTIFLATCMNLPLGEENG